MSRYYGADFKAKLRAAAAREAELKEARSKGKAEVKELFPTVASVASSRGTAAQTSHFLKVANQLPVDARSAPDHFKKVLHACEIGMRIYPGTFTEEFCRIMRYRAKIIAGLFHDHHSRVHVCLLAYAAAHLEP